MSTVFHRAALCAGLFAATGISSFVTPAQAARREKVVGVPGWTTGSNTYLRVRPGTATPPVAKVARRTRLYVWGTFNGWYRVETHDGKFGWIYHDYLNVPEAHKLKELSHRKAKVASDRTSHQTLYGSPDLLRNYYAQYGGRGAVKGLEKQGVRIASSRRAKPERKTAKVVVSAPRVVVAPVVKTPKVVAKSVAVRPVSTRIASAPAAVVVKTEVVKTAPAKTTRAIVKAEARSLPYVAPTVETPRVEAPRVEAPRVATAKPVASVERRVETPRVGTPRVETPRVQASHVEAPLGGQMLAFAAPAVESRVEARPVESNRTVTEPSQLGMPLAPQRIADARWEQERVQELARLRALQERALSERAETTPQPSPLSVQRTLDDRRAEEARAQEAQRLEDARRAADAYRITQAKAAEAKAAEKRNSANARRVAAQKAAQRKAAARRKASSSRSRRARIAAQREAQRKLLRQRMGGASESVATQIHPLTPEELLRAREQYLTSRRKTRPTVPAEPTLTPSSYESTKAQITHAIASDAVTAEAVESSDVASSWGAFAADFRPAYGGEFQLVENHRSLKSESWWTAPMWPTKTTVSAQQKSANTLGGDAASNTSTQGATQKPANQSAKVAAKPKAATKTTTRVVNRGGSPRDYARYMQNRMAKGSFGDAVANKALSYRGMPYIFGSASPRRGFDCSGLIYSILRQRGLNPPRTASGLARYGKPVSLKEAKKGDIILFANTYKRGVSHCGIYLGDGKFVHAARTGSGVRVDSLNSRYYGGKFHSIRRVQ